MYLQLGQPLEIVIHILLHTDTHTCTYTHTHTHTHICIYTQLTYEWCETNTSMMRDTHRWGQMYYYYVNKKETKETKEYDTIQYVLYET